MNKNNSMNKLFFVLVLITLPIILYSEESPDGVACAIYVDDDPNVKDKILSKGCKKGDPLLFYNYSNKAKWNLMYSLRISALSTCDMTQPISDNGVIGGQPYQSIFCTFSGKFREVKADEKYIKGWNWKP